MSDNRVRDLLDSVSAGQPHAHRLSVNDLVRAGRRRQHRVASSVAGGTAVVVAGAAALATHAGRVGSSAEVGAASTPPVTATTGQPDPSASAPWPVPTVTLLSTISAAHLLANGTQVGTFVTTDGCPTAPILRVVSQGADQVVLSLAVPTQAQAQAPAAAAAVNEASPSAAAQHCPAGRIHNATNGMPAGSVEVLADLKTALGGRALVDEATGRAIPYTADTQTASPTWVPAGWLDSTGVRPVDLTAWEQDWSTATGLLSLRQTFNAPDSLGGAANSTVSGQPARVVENARAVEVTWWAGGRLYDLAATGTQFCPLPQPSATLVGCTPASEPTGRPLSESDLLRVADSVQTH